MMLRKVMAGIIAGALATAAMVTAVSAADLNLGAFNWENNEHQKGWRPDGVDDVANPGLTSEQLKSATSLVLNITGEPSGESFFVIWQGNVDSWGWNQTEYAMADVLNGNTITIDLSKMKNYADFIDADNTSTKIAIGYWGSADDDGNQADISELGTITAKLTGVAGAANAGGNDAGANAGANANAGGDGSKEADLGVSSVAVLAGVAIVATGAIVLSRKRK